MAVHTLHIFDRKGKTLFTKRYVKASKKESGKNSDPEQLSEQRKLVFGMLFSLRELVGSLAPESERKGTALHSVRTGAGTLHNYETMSGLRFALYTTNAPSESSSAAANIRKALQHVYTEIWVETVVRSPLYNTNGSFDIKTTNFEKRLDAYLMSMPWFR